MATFTLRMTFFACIFNFVMSRAYYASPIRQVASGTVKDTSRGSCTAITPTNNLTNFTLAGYTHQGTVSTTQVDPNISGDYINSTSLNSWSSLQATLIFGNITTSTQPVLKHPLTHESLHAASPELDTSGRPTSTTLTTCLLSTTKSNPSPQSNTGRPPEPLLESSEINVPSSTHSKSISTSFDTALNSTMTITVLTSYSASTILPLSSSSSSSEWIPSIPVLPGSAIKGQITPSPSGLSGTNLSHAGDDDDALLDGFFSRLGGAPSH